MGATVATYYYDPFGRRLYKDVAGSRTYFMYASEGLIAELDATGTVTQSYSYTPQSTYGTSPLTTKTAGGYAYYQLDHLGTPQQLVNKTGVVVWKAKALAFGDATVEVNTVTNNLRFPGQYFDGETGTFYNYFRDFDAEAGRYLESDPIGLAGGLNAYGYVSNNPFGWIDPMGLYSTRAHNYFIKKFGRINNLSQAEIKQIMMGSEYADIAGLFALQDPLFSYVHAMTSEKIKSKKDACKMANDYISREMKKFNNRLNGTYSFNGNGSRDAFFYLGMALHTAMDSTSPAHKGFQLWNDSELPRHGPDSFATFPRSYTEEGLSSVINNKELTSETLSIMNKVMSGGKLDCGCYE